ncbi:HAD family hydrolase [Paraneptunicella aestuarii]|uniref:HAD family hydrolase n=1 Tax=Paraneptunicella aestuarii TaxID=2831148 RepID=UPI001E36F4E6|nr:HAD family hydrolase [Paraneptunicella aestuarii]UAA38205.1 HAD family hydrolase [Paraneptunicella aestuarii]
MKPNIQGVIFDLDDTLLTANIDFAAIREAIGCEPGKDILAYAASLDSTKSQWAYEIIREYELHDAKDAQWIPGAKDMLDALHAANIPTAIVTRNSQEAVQIKLSNNQVNIDRVITREHAPPKPDPTALLLLAQEWQLNPKNVAYVGDFLYDILAANNANMHACLYLKRGWVDYAEKADFTFEDYTELQRYVLG